MMKQQGIVRGPDSEAEYVATQRRIAAKLAPGRERQESTPVLAYISDGRWVADCVCNAASIVHPSYTEAHCAECGAVAPLVFPEAWAEIEEVLMLSPTTGARNWQGETVAELTEKVGDDADTEKGAQ